MKRREERRIGFGGYEPDLREHFHKFIQQAIVLQVGTGARLKKSREDKNEREE